jgi:hypothetical protein
VLIGLDTLIVIVSLGIGPPTRFVVRSCEDFQLERWRVQAEAYWKRTGINPGGQINSVSCGPASWFERLPDDEAHRALRKFYRDSVLLEIP